MSSQATLENPKWWQWATVLSLDAPAVAITWQWMFASVAHVSLHPHHYFLLGLGVWMIYAADRWLEGLSLVEAQIQTQRHHFYYRLRWPVAAVGLTVFLLSSTLAVRTLSRNELVGGLSLSIPVLTYTLSHQFLHRTRKWRVPKEICIAVLFAAGCSLFPFLTGARALLALPVSLFACICFTNCVLIAIWEREVDAAHGQMSLALQAPKVAAIFPLLPWLVTAVAFPCFAFARGNSKEAFACIVGSGLLMGTIHLLERKIGRRIARVLVDLALLTPFAIFIIHKAGR